MKLYGAPVSPYVRKVLAYAANKGIDIELVVVGLKDHPAEFLECSPFKKIPAFRDGDFTISDSTAIITYLEAKFPEPALLPADPESRARVIWFDEFADTIFTSAAGAPFFNRVVAPMLGMDHDLEAANVAETVTLPPIFAYVESVILDSGFLVGVALTLADISVASVYVNALHAGIVIDAAIYPKTAAWLGRIHALPGFAEWLPRERKMLNLA
jgi:glutathione S-transferase